MSYHDRLNQLSAQITALPPAELRALFEHLPPLTVASLITTLPFGTADEPNKLLALTVSNEMTYDEGQALYHFAVLVTRLLR